MSASRRDRATTARLDACTRRPSRRRCVCPRRPSRSSGPPGRRPGSPPRLPRGAWTGSSSGSGAPLPASHRSVRTSSGEICSNTDVSVCPAWASPPTAVHGHHPTSRPSARSRLTARVSAPTLPPWPLTKTRRRGPAGRRPAVLHQQHRQGLGADGDRAGETPGAHRWLRRRWPVPPASRARAGPQRCGRLRSRSECRYPAAGADRVARSSPAGSVVATARCR